jgi:hypothetical protein
MQGRQGFDNLASPYHNEEPIRHATGPGETEFQKRTCGVGSVPQQSPQLRTHPPRTNRHVVVDGMLDNFAGTDVLARH